MSQPPSDLIIPPTPTPPRVKSLSRRTSKRSAVAILRSNSEEPFCHLATAVDIIAAASRSVLTTFKVANPLAPSESVILAEWMAPPNFTIRTLSISPDASVIALILADNVSAVLVLLRPRSLIRLLRVALPWSKEVYARQVFFSHASLALRDDQKLRQNMLPQHLQAAFHHLDKQTSQRDVSTHPQARKEDAAPFSLAVALDLLLVYSFTSCYNRVHAFSSHQNPSSSADLMSLPTLPTKEYTPVLHDNTFLHTLQNPLLPMSDLRIVKLLALCGKPPALLALVQLPSAKLAASVFHEHSVMITPLIVRNAGGILFANCGTGGYILETFAQDVCRIADVSFDKTIGMRVSALPRRDNEQSMIYEGHETRGDQLSFIVHQNDSVIKILAIHDVIHIEALPCKLPFL